MLDVNTGEVLGMSSVPDYDSNDRGELLDPNKMNRASVGVYEMGSTFKGFTLAMALDSGAAKVGNSFDATNGLHVGGFTIHDFHGKHRWLTVPEIFIYSSNVGAARMALATGLEGQHEYLKRFGLLDELHTELPESGAPIVPKMPWPTVTRVTMAFGHGISVSPLQTAAASAALVNGGFYVTPTFLPRTLDEAAGLAQPHPEAGDQRYHAQALPPQRAEGLRPPRRGRGLQRRRQDRHGREGGERPLYERASGAMPSSQLFRWTSRNIWYWS